MRRIFIAFVFVFFITGIASAQIKWNAWDKENLVVTGQGGLSAYYMSIIGNGTWNWEASGVSHQLIKTIDMNYSNWGVFLGFNLTSYFELTGEFIPFSLYGGDGWFTEAKYYAGEGRQGFGVNIYPPNQFIMVGIAFKYPLLRLGHSHSDFNYYSFMPTVGVDAVFQEEFNEIKWWPKIGLTINLSKMFFIQAMYKFPINDLSGPGDTVGGDSYYKFENVHMFSIRIGFNMRLFSFRGEYYRVL
jgi:hypothetical protein